MDRDLVLTIASLVAVVVLGAGSFLAYRRHRRRRHEVDPRSNGHARRDPEV